MISSFRGEAEKYWSPFSLLGHALLCVFVCVCFLSQLWVTARSPACSFFSPLCVHTDVGTKDMYLHSSEAVKGRSWLLAAAKDGLSCSSG